MDSLSRTMPPSSPTETWFCPRKTSPLRVIATTMASSLSASGMLVVLSTLAISICTLCWSMGVITMKMMSSTSMTSTMGVTLIFELTLPPSLRTVIPILRLRAQRIFVLDGFRRCRQLPDRREVQRGGQKRTWLLRPPKRFPLCQQPLRLAPVVLLDEVIDQLARGVVHLHVESLDTPGEIVEGHDGRDGHKQPEGRGDQRLRDTTGDRADAGGLLGGDLLEGVENTDDGTEQSNERRRGADGGQHRKAPLQLGVNDSLSPLQCAARARDRLFGRQAG